MWPPPRIRWFQIALASHPSLRVNPRLEKDDTKIQNYSLNQCNITRFYLVTLIFIAIASG
jgi:hypothetical protein